MVWNCREKDGIYKDSIPYSQDLANASRVHLDSIITQGGPFTDPDSDLGQGTIARLEDAKVLLVSILVLITKPFADQASE